ncbi:hypothetical protein BGZ61DRAFT_474531 [Ilyonectria robusta]|uniref:uncharacterized protein n=1 Tax=Ilyonectria robusta TaxID=1079257 RepID=UPI001E8E976B|nr:uncharacterized protein BGZ61DRAFT_474531 [Ilyonectria robusta]KAH8733894.1 hypothetical protein BGZ61DRAFT_474531 [Ilyonectria robusta]
MARLVTLATWALSLASVHATQPTSGWQVDVAASEVYISWDSDSSDGGLIVEFPVNITRIIATANSFALTISTTPYLFNSTAAGEETSEADVIYTQNIDVPPADQFSQAVYIHMAEPQQDVLISLGLDDGSAGSAFITVNSTGFVIARDAEQQGSWAARVIADYDHQVNLAITEDFNNAISNGIDEADPRDLGKAPVIHRNEVKPVDKNSDGESWTTTTLGGYTSTSTTDSSTSTTSPDGGSAPPDDTYVSTAIPGDDYSPPDGYTYTGTTGDEVTTTVSGGCGRGGAHTIIITRYRTVSVCPTPSACTSDNKHLLVRQTPDRPAHIRGAVIFADRNLERRPVRFLPCYLHYDIYSGDEKIGSKGASATTDANGFAVFRFNIGDGQRVEATRIFTFLFTEWFYIGSRKLDTEQLTPKVLQLDLNTVKWSVNAGEITGAEAYYGFSEYNQGLAVADAFTTLTEFVRTQVATGENEMEKVNVWFPGAADSGAYFASYGDPPYINLPQLDAANPSVMAHEYGHWLHWIARKRGELRAGGWHQFCGDGIDKKVTTAFSEGYATAFGLFAIDQTPLVDAFSPYMEYQKRQYAPKKSWSQNIEAFNCGDSFMLRQEGRIAAALFDLVDRKLDEFPTSSNNLGRISDGFDPQKLNWMWSPRFIFWLLMQDNPQNIEEYWRKFQKYPDQTTEWEDRAWSIFDYNYADFPQHV